MRNHSIYLLSLFLLSFDCLRERIRGWQGQVVTHFDIDQTLRHIQTYPMDFQDSLRTHNSFDVNWVSICVTVSLCSRYHSTPMSYLQLSVSLLDPPTTRTCSDSHYSRCQCENKYISSFRVPAVSKSNEVRGVHDSIFWHTLARRDILVLKCSLYTKYGWDVFSLKTEYISNLVNHLLVTSEHWRKWYIFWRPSCQILFRFWVEFRMSSLKPYDRPCIVS